MRNGNFRISDFRLKKKLLVFDKGEFHDQGDNVKN
jgi:hypothetical protein